MNKWRERFSAPKEPRDANEALQRPEAQSEFEDFCTKGLDRLVLSFIDRLEDDKLLHQESWPVYYTLLSDDPAEREREYEAMKQDIASAFERSKVMLREHEGEFRKVLEWEGIKWHEVVDLKELPEGFKDDPSKLKDLQDHGLLYQPFAYPVPGAAYNEFYPWDSKFWLDAVLEANDKESEKRPANLLRIGRGVVENLGYQVEHYGLIPNGTRSYYLTRSQPPFFVEMALNIYTHAKEHDNWQEFDPESRKDKTQTPEAWLEKLLPAMVANHNYWTSGSRLAGDTGLSRYIDDGEGKAPEVLGHEPHHYEHARDHFKRKHEEVKKGLPAGADVESRRIFAQNVRQNTLFYDAEKDELTPLYYKAVRSMRSSGFDISDRFGYGGLETMFTAPVCLNSLLYQQEMGIAEVFRILGNQGKAGEWEEKAQSRKALMDKYLWDEEKGIYIDYNFEIAEGRRAEKPYYNDIPVSREYPFATGLWPLWVGMFDKHSEEDMRRVQSIRDYHIEEKALIGAHGIFTSSKESGFQWDKPMVWPPLQMASMEALMRYDFIDDAKRIGEGAVKMFTDVWNRTGKLFEKYNGRDGNERTGELVKDGYTENESSVEGFFAWSCAAGIKCSALLREATRLKAFQKETPVPLESYTDHAGSNRPGDDATGRFA